MWVCASVCAKKFVRKYLTSKLTDLNENFGVCCNWPRIENLPWTVQSDQYFPLIWGGECFFEIFRTPVSQELLEIAKCGRPANCVCVCVLVCFTRPAARVLHVPAVSFCHSDPPPRPPLADEPRGERAVSCSAGCSAVPVFSSA